MKLLKNIQVFFLVFFTACLCSCERNEISQIWIFNKGDLSMDEKKACEISYIQGINSDEFSAKIKYRGGMSVRYEKKSYTLELKDKFSLANLPKEDDWILNANYIDKTFMRHKVSYDLFRAMNPQNIAAQCNYVNLFVNAKYEGLYVLMQELNASILGVNKKDSMGMVFKDPPIFYDKIVEWFPLENYYQQKYPKVHQQNNETYIKSFIDFIFNASDEDFAKSIETWVDLENVLDWHLMLLLSNNSDGIMKNFYLYKIDKTTPFRFAIWDCDHSFGRDGDNELNMMERPIDCNRSILLKRLSLLPEYQEKMKARWLALREANVFSVEAFDQYIQENNELLKDDLAMNFEKWPIESKWYFDNNNYEQELDILLRFVELRLGQLDEYFGVPKDE